MTRTLRLYGAVVYAIKAHFDTNEVFSAYDITTFIRDLMDAGELDLHTPYGIVNDAGNVKHELVKSYVSELYDNDLFPGTATRSNSVANNGARFMLYTPENVSGDYNITSDYNDEFEVSKSLTVNDVTVTQNSNGSVTVTSPSGKEKTL